MSIKESDAIKHYVDPKTGYWGKTKQMKKYRMMLNKIYALQRHKEVTSKHLKKQYKREGAIRPFFSVQVDLADFPKLQNPLNNNNRYLLVCICVFSRYLWVLPLKTKANLHVALETVFKQMQKEFHTTPENVTGDNEFDTNELKNLAKKYKFRWWFGDPNEKYRTGIVERVIRTIRNLIKRYLTQNDTTKYIDVLQDLVDNYNDTEHGHTRSRPKVAIKSGQTFPRPMKNKIKILRAGDRVRILQKRKRAFDKGDKPYYSKKMYEIIKKDGNKYVLRDTQSNEILTKTYYIHQLLNVNDVIHDKYKPNNDNVGYDKGIQHKVKQRKNKRALRGLDINNIIDEKERSEVARGLSYNDKNVFHDKPLPKNINDKQLEKKQKQLENKVEQKIQISREQQLNNQIALYKRSHSKNKNLIISRIQKRLDELRKQQRKPKPKPKPKVRRSTRIRRPPRRYRPPKPKPKPSKKQVINNKIKQLQQDISNNRKRRMYVVRVRRKIVKLREQLAKLEPIKRKRALRRGTRKRRKPKRFK